MQTKHLSTFVAIAILAGAIIFTTTSGMFARADNNTDEEEDEIAELQGMDDEEDEDEAEDEDEDENEFTTSFMAENCTFNSTGRNPFFILEPDYQLAFAGVCEGVSE